MNIRIIKIISLFCLFLQIAGCQNKDTSCVAEILIATPVNISFVSSAENSDLNIGGKKYWVHYKVNYKNDTLIQFQRYLPEGPIEYSIEELKTDTAICKSLNIPFKHNWYIYNNELYENTRKSDVEIVKLDETHFIEQNGRRIFVIKYKN